MADFTIARLIADVQRHASVPRNQNVFSDPEFAATFNDAMQMRIIPAVLKTREEFFVKERLYSQADLTQLPDERFQLLLPERTIGNRLRKVEMVRQNETLDTEVPRLSPDQRLFFGYVFQGNRLLLSDTLFDTADTLRLQYFRRPSLLVERARVGQVLAINTFTGSVTLDNVPDCFAVGEPLDLQAAAEPFETLAEDVTIVAIAGFNVQIDPATSELLTVGDYLCCAKETIIPQIPVELHPILVQYAVAQVLKALGKLDSASAVMADLPILEQNLYAMLEDRDEGSPQKITPNNHLWSPQWRRSRW